MYWITREHDTTQTSPTITDNWPCVHMQQQQQQPRSIVDDGREYLCSFSSPLLLHSKSNGALITEARLPLVGVEVVVVQCGSCGNANGNDKAALLAQPAIIRIGIAKPGLITRHSLSVPSERRVN